MFVKDGKDDGKYGLILYPIGIPTIVYVDDFIPFNKNRNMPFFARLPDDGSIWGLILEKAWAKVTGNYEMTQGGWVDEALRVMTGAPIEKYKTKSFNNKPQECFKVIKEALSRGYILAA